MTLGRFLVFVVVGLAAAWIFQLSWLYWLIAIAALWVVFQLVRA